MKFRRNDMLVQKIQDRLSFYNHFKHRPAKLAKHTVLEVARSLQWSKVPALPSILDIEPINQCNFRCPHCQVTHWNKAKARLDVDGLNKLLDQFPNLLRVKLQGMGEPLLNKELLPMLDVLEKRGIHTAIVSNGSVMTDTIRDKLLELPTDIQFSIDGATKDVFESVRVASNFDKVTANIKSLTTRRKEIKSRNPHKELAGRTVVTNQNIHQLPDIVRLVKELGLDTLTLQLIMTSWGKTSMEEINSKKRVEEAKLLQEQVCKAKEEAERIGLPLVVRNDDKYSCKNKCGWPWKSAFIASNGDVVPCAILADSDTMKMGNVFEENFETIWNSEKYQELRRQHREHDLPEYCKSCYLGA
jgi:radical SAM protein with 4Fe4S-binding SPASM domain